jgi:hypothetical protein
MSGGRKLQVPQGLKPLLNSAASGAAKAVPFQEQQIETHALQGLSRDSFHKEGGC